MSTHISKFLKASPFIKWAGGKTKLLPELVKNVPPLFNRYWEPFLGGGALFYELYHLGMCPGTAYLTDVNRKLINAYRWVAKSPDYLCEKLIAHKKNHSRDYYYQVRNLVPWRDSIEEAAQFIYLNKTCFNGLYRENKSGRFNVPVGDYDNPAIFTECSIDLCHQALRVQTITACNYSDIHPAKGDFVYLDPPYYGSSSSFTSYTKEGFNEKEHFKLRDFCNELDAMGVYFMLSNSYTGFTRELYKDYNVISVSAPRSINSKGNSRGNISEILVKNY